MSARIHPHSGPAFSMIVVSDIPVGLRALDALAKEAMVELLAAGTIHCGNYLLAFCGEVEPSQRCHARACAQAADCLLDEVLLPRAEERIVPAWRQGTVQGLGKGDTLGVIQTRWPPTMIRAVDAALKGAEVELIELRIGDGLGGKALATLWGETCDVEAALAYAKEALATGRGESSSTAVIPNADSVVRQSLGEGTRFFKEWRG